MGKRILCIGDSNTWGYDPRSFFGSQYPADVRWTGLLEQAGWQVVNLGQNGMCIPGEVQYPVMEILIRSKLPADVLTLMLGSNDLLGGRTAEVTSARMERFLLHVRDAASETRLILIAPPVMREGEWVQSRRLMEESARLSVCYRILAGRAGIEFADAEDWGVGILFDGVHFSPEGHRSFAEGLKRTLEAARCETSS